MTRVHVITFSQVCELPRMVGRTFFRRLAGEQGTAISKEEFLKFWTAHKLFSAPIIKRVYEVLRNEGEDVSLTGAVRTYTHTRALQTRLPEA